MIQFIIIGLLLSPTIAISKELPSFSKRNEEPMLATTCPPTPTTPTTPTSPNPPPTNYLLQYYTTPTWTPTPATPPCITDKLEILKTCQKLYPSRDISNIVEKMGHSVGVACKEGQICSGGVVTVWRCLESPFQSDALLVPSPCIFDHIHNSSSCWDSIQWNKTAVTSCSKRQFQLKSFAVLLPCGVGLFTGVEFVCCPEEKGEEKYDEEEEEEEEEDYYFDEATQPPPTPPTTLTTPTLDPYFTSQTSELNEHSSFKQAEIRLENLHRLRMSKVMKDWEELEKKYQIMKGEDPGGAENFKKSVTVRFQKTIRMLEEEGVAEKEQLMGVHQQRVLSHLTTRKKESMECFTTSLTSPTPNPNKIRKCLEKLMRILHKDRHHTLTHYKHLIKSNMKQAEVEEDYTLQRLTQISATARQGVVMLERYPPLSAKLRPLIEDYVLSLQGRDDLIGESLLTATHETEKALLEKLKKGEEPDKGEESEEPSTTPPPPPATTPPTTEPPTTPPHDYHDSLISVRREVYSHVSMTTKKPIFVTLTFAGVAALLGVVLVGGGVWIKKRGDSPRRRGFLQVNQQLTPPTQLKSPEEKHVANMQINGYENPTYKYFEQNT